MFQWFSRNNPFALVRNDRENVFYCTTLRDVWCHDCNDLQFVRATCRICIRFFHWPILNFWPLSCCFSLFSDKSIRFVEYVGVYLEGYGTNGQSLPGRFGWWFSLMFIFLWDVSVDSRVGVALRRKNRKAYSLHETNHPKKFGGGNPPQNHVLGSKISFRIKVYWTIPSISSIPSIPPTPASCISFWFGRHTTALWATKHLKQSETWWGGPARVKLIMPYAEIRAVKPKPPMFICTCIYI